MFGRKSFKILGIWKCLGKHFSKEILICSSMIWIFKTLSMIWIFRLILFSFFSVKPFQENHWDWISVYEESLVFFFTAKFKVRILNLTIKSGKDVERGGRCVSINIYIAISRSSTISKLNN